MARGDSDVSGGRRYMTSSGRYVRQTVAMDLFELARTFQADRRREIEAQTRRRQLLEPVARTGTTPRSDREERPTSSAVQRPASTTSVPR